MKPETFGVGKIFQPEICWQIPRFQRPYVWKRDENWEPLWEDIRDTADQFLDGDEDCKPHFLGAIVADKLDGPSLFENQSVVDGQQRIITLQVFIKVLRDYCKEIGDENHFDIFDDLTSNSRSYARYDEFLYKVRPSRQDKDDFYRVLDVDSPDQLRDHYEVRGNTIYVGDLIPEAYLFFDRELRQWINYLNDVSTDKAIEAMWLALADGLQVVVIQLEENDQPQLIFHTLNARGTPLLQSDLVKNFLFQQAEKENLQVDHLNAKYWSLFEDNFWRKEVRQGRLKRPRLDVYLQHYLTLRQGEAIKADELFATYESTFPFDAISNGVKEHFSELHSYGETYNKIYNLQDLSRAKVFMERLQILDTSTVVPVVLKLFNDYYRDNLETLNRALNHLESYLIRRMVCNLTTKNYNRFFSRLAKELLGESENSDEIIKNYLLGKKEEAVYWPDDEEFQQAWLQQPVYNNLAQKRVRLVLQAIDNEKERENNKSVDVIYNGSLTIEHLMPEQWGPHWEIEDESHEKVTRRNQLINTFGNLTLITQSLNSSISNGKWENKLPAILENVKTNISRELKRYEGGWNEQTIHDRGKELFKYAQQIWPFPAK